MATSRQDRKLHLRRPDTALLLTVGLSYALVAVILNLLVPDVSGSILLGLALLILAGFALELYRRGELDRIATVRQVQALVGLHTVLRPRRPLPTFTGWAASPELVSTLVRLIQDHRPLHVLELGSGASTVVMAYALERLGAGRVTAVDHDDQYAAETQRELSAHGLEAFASVVTAPLANQAMDGTSWMWYDLGNAGGEQIDILVVDGPPRETQSMARYPALPMLYDRLTDGALIVLDDAFRDDEQEALKRWLDAYPEFSLSYQESAKGIAILSRNGGSGGTHG